MIQKLENRADVFRAALRDFARQLPFRNIGAKLKILRLVTFGSDADVEQTAGAIESILASEGEPLPAFGDGSNLARLEKLIELFLKYLPLILSLF